MKFVVFLALAGILIVSACVQKVEDGGTSPSSTRISIGAIIFTNQSVSTQAEAEAVFSTQKEEMWNVYPTPIPFPIFDAMKVYPFDQNSPEASEDFMGNFGTIKFTAEIPYSNIGPNPGWKIENGAAVLRSCKSGLAVQVDNQTPVCSASDTVWIQAPFLKYWLNNDGIIFARAGFYSPFNATWEQWTIDVPVGNETDIKLTIIPKQNVNGYNLAITLPPELQLVLGDATWAGNLVASQPLTLTWRIKGATPGQNFYAIVKGKSLATGVNINVLEPATGVGIGTN